MKTITLPQTPATGVLPNDLLEMKGGYKVQSLEIDHGDILFLYTDGIEEAKRLFRNRSFAEIVCAENNAPLDTPHGTHSVGQNSEEMTPQRIEEIQNAVMNKRMYTLYKYHNPHGDIEYHFDFTNCAGTPEDVIMAMVSVEKVFRLYKNPLIGNDVRVLVDKKIDSFLHYHFVEYNNYVTGTAPNPDDPTYLYYLGVQEDEQYDDLTILGIYRK
jgi:hypothetical protein